MVDLFSRDEMQSICTANIIHRISVTVVEKRGRSITYRYNIQRVGGRYSILSREGRSRVGIRYM